MTTLRIECIVRNLRRELQNNLHPLRRMHSEYVIIEIEIWKYSPIFKMWKLIQTIEGSKCFVDLGGNIISIVTSETQHKT